MGRPGRRDLAVTVAVLALEPVTEWLIHRMVLHAPPRQVLGHTVDIGATHRLHHRDPDDLALTVTTPARSAIAIGLIAAQSTLVARAARGGKGDPPSTITGLAVSYGALLRYEWMHYLMHADYRARSARFRRTRLRHLMHHYRNERYWLGITSSSADRLFSTLPTRANEVPRSPTAHHQAA